MLRGSYFYKDSAMDEYYHGVTDELLDRIIIKTMLGGKIIMARKIIDPSILSPLQMDTAIIVPNATVPGVIEEARNVVGSVLGGKIVTKRTSAGLPLPGGSYRFEIINSGAAYRVTNLETGFTSADVTPEANPNLTLIPGVSVTVPDLTGCVDGDYADVDILGDSTFIIPGTVLGKLNSGANKGRFEVATDENLAAGKYDFIRISSGTLETDASKRTIGSDGGTTSVTADTLTVAVYVFAQLKKAVCQNVNLTSAMEAKLQGIVWQ